MDQVWKGLSNLDPRDPGGFYKKPLLSVNSFYRDLMFKQCKRNTVKNIITKEELETFISNKQKVNYVITFSRLLFNQENKDNHEKQLRVMISIL